MCYQPPPRGYETGEFARRSAIPVKRKKKKKQKRREGIVRAGRGLVVYDNNMVYNNDDSIRI